MDDSQTSYSKSVIYSEVQIIDLFLLSTVNTYGKPTFSYKESSN